MDLKPNQTRHIIGKYEYERINHSPYLLGKGHYGRVYKGWYPAQPSSPEEIVAIKVCPITRDNWIILKRELSVLYALNQHPHPNIIRAIDYRESPNSAQAEFIFVFEYVAGKTLADFLRIQPKKSYQNIERRFLREDTARVFMIQLASALEHLHRYGIFHRDLKPDNILLTEQSFDATLKICDFGFAKFISSENELNTSGVGTPVYVAPEILRTADNSLRENIKYDKTIAPLVYTSKSDLYSVGTIFYEMIFGEKFTKDCNTNQEIYLKTKARTVVILPPNEHNNLSDDGRNLMIGLLQNTPEKRFSWKEFFDHVYLQPQNLTRSTISKAKSEKSISLNKKIERVPSELTFLQRVDFIGTGQVVFQIAPSQSVLSLKLILGIFVAKQFLLTLDGILLEDRCFISDYGLDKKSQILFLLSQDFFKSTSIHASVDKLSNMKFSMDKLKDSSMKRNKISSLHFKEELVRQFFEGVFEKERQLKSQYKRIMIAYKTTKHFSSQIQIFCNSYQSLWNHAQNQCRAVSEKIKINDLYTSQKNNVVEALMKKDSVISALQNLSFPTSMGGGSVLSKVSTFFDYHSKFRELSEISQRLSYFYEERPTLQEIQDLTAKLAPDTILSWVKENFSIFDSINKEKRLLNKEYQEYTTLVEEMSQYIEKAQTWSIEQLNNANNLLTFNASMNRKIDLIQKSFGNMEAESLSLKKLQDERLRLLASTFMEKYSNLQSSVLEKIVNLNNRTLEYDKLTVRFLLLLRECMCFIDIPNEFPSCLQEIVRRREYNAAVSSVNSLLKEECDLENKMREAFKNNHQLEPSPVLDKIKLNVDPVSIHVKSYPEDSRLPPVQRAEIQKYLGLPQQSNKEVEGLSIENIRNTASSQVKILQELNGTLDRLIDLNQKKIEIELQNQKEAEAKKLEKYLEIVQHRRQELEITHYEIFSRKSKLDETLRDLRSIPRDKFVALRSKLDYLEKEMFLDRNKSLRIILENKSSLYDRNGAFNDSLFLDLYGFI